MNEIDNLFGNFRRSPFRGDDPNRVPDLGQSQGSVSQAGFVDNVENESTNVSIDADGLHVANGEITVTNSSGGAFIGDGSITSPGADVVIDASGITVVDGAITVTNAAATVIIDGTSNMFKIAASGTITASALAGSFDIEIVTLSGLGAQASTLAALGFLGSSTLGTSARYGAHLIEAPNFYAASVSGGSPTSLIMGMTTYSTLVSQLNGSNEPALRLDLFNYGNSSAADRYCKYYVLQEAAI